MLLATTASVIASVSFVAIDAWTAGGLHAHAVGELDPVEVRVAADQTVILLGRVERRILTDHHALRDAPRVVGGDLLAPRLLELDAVLDDRLQEPIADLEASLEQAAQDIAGWLRQR